ncbi:MAG: ATP-binding protein [Blautia sp.]
MKEQARLRQDQDFLIQESLKKNRQFQEQTQKQLEVYRSYLENQEYKRASACISHLASDFQQKRFHPICSDDLINAILAHKQSLAKSHNIRVEYKILLPDHLDILPSDLSSVFFNLMDNGIDGCMQSGSKSPFIRLTTSFASDFISIQMCNSKNPAQRFHHKTSKQNSISHGFGLSIIQDICDKNDGTCQWEDKGEVFESMVLLRYQ